LLGQPNRLQIVFTIAREEACVCHIEAVLGIRQATISQHLMVLRDAGLVTAHRDGRNIFYRLANPGLLAAVIQVAQASGSSLNELERLSHRPVENCSCPHCNPGIDPALACKPFR
jgi:ArsR family transcriptional regulator